jgi:hypothetical protein
MKTLVFLLLLGSATRLLAQTTNQPLHKTVAHPAPAAVAPTNSPVMTAPANTNSAAAVQRPTTGWEGALSWHQPKANEIVLGKLTYSGSVIEAVKTRRPWQLFNPVARAQYGSPEDNLARDPVNGRVEGLKFFAIHF